MGIHDVTRSGVDKAMLEHDRLGEEKFLDFYKFGRAQTYFVLFEGKAYSSKAILGVGHKYSGDGWQQLGPYDFHGGPETLNCLKKLGFTEFTDDPDQAEGYVEGERQKREVWFFTRNPKLMGEAKAFHGVICQACGFDFKAVYGSRGEGYIECHHRDPLAEQGGIAQSTLVSNVAVLCSNCHRMIHRNRKAISVEELKTIIDAARGT